MASRKKAAKKVRSDPPVAVRELDGLPPKQRHFVLEYLSNGFNATQAAIVAGYSKKTADSQGSRLLKNVKVAAMLAERMQASLAKREITAERLLDEAYKLAFYDVRKLFRQDGSLIPITELGDDEAAAIAGLDVKELYEEKCPIGQLKKIKLADKGMGIERLMRYKQMFTERVEHSGTVGVQLVHSVPRPQRETKT